MKETLFSRAEQDLKKIQSYLESQYYLLWLGSLPGIQSRQDIYNKLQNAFKGAKELGHDTFLYNQYVELEKKLSVGWIKDILSQTILEVQGAQILVRENLPPLSMTETQTYVVANTSKIEISSKRQETTEFKQSKEETQTTAVEKKSKIPLPPPPPVQLPKTTIKTAALAKSTGSTEPMPSFDNELRAKLQKRNIALNGEKYSSKTQKSLKTPINPLAQSILSNPLSQKFFQDLKDSDDNKVNYDIPTKSYQ